MALTPCGVAFANGHLYIGDTHTRFNFGLLRQMSPGSSQLTNPIGTYGGGGLRSGIPASSASVGPCAAAGDHSGNLVIGDLYHDVIRVVAASTGTFYGQAMTAGNIYTVAGGGTRSPGDGGPAANAKLKTPTGVTVDAGNLVIGDSGDQRIWEVTG